MPRIYNSVNYALDFCMQCFPKTEVKGREKYAGTGTVPDSRGDCFDYDAEHPPYEHLDYCCTKCGRTLTEKDNWVVE